MGRPKNIPAPFFEVGPKGHLYGNDMVTLARQVAACAREYDVRVILTPQFTDLRAVADAAPDAYVFAQHMDSLPPGRGQGRVLPEAVAAAGAKGVMLNHAERPLPLGELEKTIHRAHGLGLLAMACADTLAQARAAACLGPDILIAEPTELIGTGTTSDMDYVLTSMQAVRGVDESIMVLQGAGISTPEDVYRVVRAGADATGCTSGIFKAPDPAAMARDMLRAVRMAWDDRNQ